MKNIIFCSVVLVSFFSSLVVASNYPSDMEIKSECQEKGAIRVCRGMQISGFAVLNIYYNGFLKNVESLRVYVKINYKDGSRAETFPMIQIPSTTSDTHSFVKITGGCLIGSMGGCKVTGTPEMKNLLLWAQQPYNYILNELSLELAFFADGYEWDNNLGYGSNYRFHFNHSN